VDGVGVADDEHEEDRLVDQAPGAMGQGLVDDGGVVQEHEGVVQGADDVLDLAGGGVGLSLSLGLLGVDALLLGLQDLFGDTAVVEELDELLLLAGGSRNRRVWRSEARRATSALVWTWSRSA
jgi:hypothetical protein